MKMTFRWYGESDPVKLEYIRQIPGIYGIVSAVYDVPAGEVWPMEKLQTLRKRIEDAGLKFEVVESVPVHEDIKLGKPSRVRLIANFQQNIRNCAAAGVKVICYNFMPVFDWTRTEMARQLPDGSFTLAFDAQAVARIDPEMGIALPGWDASYKPEALKSLLDEYRSVSEEILWGNLEYFLKAIVPVAEAAGIRMAMHPDDPPRPIFGLPRIVKDRDDLARLVNIVDSPANGLTLCSGSLGADRERHRSAGARVRRHGAHPLRSPAQRQGRSRWQLLRIHPSLFRRLAGYGSHRQGVPRCGLRGLRAPRPWPDDLGRNGQARLRPV